MLLEPKYVAAVFIGGMDGIEAEFNEFRHHYSNLPVLPIASTGGAANLIYREWSDRLSLPTDLRSEVAYPYLFRKLFSQLS
jgi:hypothetical protein